MTSNPTDGKVKRHPWRLETTATAAMRRISVLVTAVALSLLVGLGAAQEDALSAPAVKNASGDLAERINSYVASIPRAGSEAYDPPTSSERKTMAAAFNAIEAGKPTRAAALAGPLKYNVVRFADTVTGRTYLMLSERQTADGSWPHAWGMYIYSRDATSDTTVEVTHPVADWNSEDVGSEVFRKANAEDLFVAGAHRDANANGSADVAHASKSVFHAIHNAAIEPSTKVFQPHGFAPDCNDTRDNDGDGLIDFPQDRGCSSTFDNDETATVDPYPEIVVSAGEAPPTRLAQYVSDELGKKGFDSGLYDGSRYSDLGATTNVQGISARAIGADFVHVEAIRSIRDNDSRRSLLSDAVAGALIQGPNDVLSAYDDAVLADDPIAYFRLDGTNVKDYSPRSHDGHYVGAPGTTTLPNGDAATVFDGSSQYAEVPDADDLSITATGALTLEAWIRPDVLEFPEQEGSGYVHWLGKGERQGDDGQQEYASRMFSYTNSEVPPRPNRNSGYAFNRSGGEGIGSYFQDPVEAGKWIHYVFVVNTTVSDQYPHGYTKIYKNGVERDQDSLINKDGLHIVPDNGMAPLRIGTRDGRSYFKGAIGKVALYGDELGRSNVLEHYQEMNS
jgi:hypothetical protein